MKLEELRARFYKQPAPPKPEEPEEDVGGVLEEPEELAPGEESQIRMSGKPTWAAVRPVILRRARKVGGWPEGTEAGRINSPGIHKPVLASDDVYLRWTPPQPGRIQITVSVGVSGGGDFALELTIPRFPGAVE